jgi:Sec-independent protein secretion pathway component TatC
VWTRVTDKRFWILVGVVLVDGLAFAIPVIGVAAIVAALVAPAWLRRAARFLEALAAGREPA